MKQIYQKTKISYRILLDFLAEQNQIHNLVAPSTIALAEERHLGDSLRVSDYIQTHYSSSKLIVDMGTGAGFPGIVIAAENQDKIVYLVDSTQKKIQFVAQAVGLMALGNSYPVCDRIESFAKTHRDAFDLAIARALAHLDVLAEYAHPLLKMGGTLLAMKSERFEEELSSTKTTIERLGYTIGSPFSYELSSQIRYILPLTKMKPSPIKLPRRVGMASGKPLF